MPTSFPARVKMSTSTTGTGTYTVAAVTAAGYRSLAQALANGDIASGDEVYYIVIDTTVTNGTNLLEIGRGIWTSGTNTVTRAEVYQPNNTAVSWGAGTRDFLVIDNPELFARLIGGATYTQGGVEVSWTGGKQITSKYDSGRFMELYSQSIGGSLRSNCLKTNKLPLYIESLFQSTGTASGETTIQFLVGDLASPTAGPKIRETGVLQTAAGVPYDAFPSGTALLFGTAPPTGWTRVNESEDIMVKVATASDTPGSAAAGSWTISGLSVSGSTDGFSLTTTHLPSHTHTMAYGVAQAQSGAGVTALDALGSGSSSATSGATGSGTAHSHGISSATISSSGAWRPRYKVYVKATKD